jgi:hypothetical protein
LESRILLLLSVAAMPIAPSIISDAAESGTTETEKAAATLEHRGFLNSTGVAWRVAHDEIADSSIDAADAVAVHTAHAALGAALRRNPDPEWRRRAVPHLAAIKDWQELAAIASEFLRKRGSERSIDARISELLGERDTPSAVALVREALPLTVRHPHLRTTAFGLAGMALGVAALLLLVYPSRDESGSIATLAIAVPVAGGGANARLVSLSRERWDANKALAAGPLSPTETWIQFEGGIDRVIARPGYASWAVEVVSPDSGEGDIELRSVSDAPIRLTWSKGQDRPGSFSPDGERIVFLTTRWSQRGLSNLAVLDLRTSLVRRLTTSVGTEDNASWSVGGEQIAFLRRDLETGTIQMCTVDVDGGHESCPHIPGWNVVAIFGWSDDHRLIVRADSAGAQSVVVVSLRNLSVGKLPGIVGRVSTDPSGEWLLFGPMDGRFSWRVAPTDRPDLWREVAVGADATQATVSFDSRGPRSDYLDSVAIDHFVGPVALGTPHLLRVKGWSKARVPMTPAVTRWRSLTPATGVVDSLGVLVGTRTGNVVVEASAGGWRVAIDTVRIEALTTDLLLDENWSSAPFERWRAFGTPRPVIVTQADGRSAFLNNGEGTFFSGVYLARTLDPSKGLAVDLEVSTPISRPQWQVVLGGLYSVPDSIVLGNWDHRTGYLPTRSPLLVQCDFAYPHGEGAASEQRMSGLENLRTATGDPQFRLNDGGWWRLRVQLLPDGRCGMALNGRALHLRSAGATRSPVYVVVQGSSVGTRILVRRVRIVAGVPTDIDWTQLTFRDGAWRLHHGR